MKYIFRGRANPWTDQQMSLLVHLREEGVEWKEVARQCGHPKQSCQTRLSEIRRKRREAAANGTPDPIRLASMRFRGAVPLRSTRASTLPVAPPSARTIRTSLLVQDAELRARIEVQGLTGGLMGDPMPGRSALDQRAGQGSGERSVSLATGPMQ